jgi:hypothetical protein
MPIRIEFNFDFPAYLRTQKLHLKSKPWRQLIYRLSLVLYPCLGAFCLFAGIPMLHDGYWAILGLLEFAFGIFLISYPLYIRWRWKRCYRRVHAGDGRTAISMNDEKIIIEAVNVKSEVAWAGITRCVQNEDLCLLYLTPGKFIPIPKQSLAAGQWPDIQTLINAHLKSD